METFIFKKNEIKKIDDLVLALGFFDALHLGHQKIIEKTVKKANNLKIKSGVLTFKQSPKNLVKNKNTSNIFDISTKSKILKSFGVDYLIILDMEKEDLINTSAKEFVQNFLMKLGVKHCICGQDYKFGKNRQGNPSDINHYSNDSISVVVAKNENINFKKISSSSLKPLLTK